MLYRIFSMESDKTEYKKETWIVDMIITIITIGIFYWWGKERPFT